MTENVKRVQELTARRAALLKRIDGHKAGTAGDELLADLEELDTALREASENVGLEDVRARVRADLVAVAFVDVEDELEVHDLNALVDAYTRLGGNLELMPAAPAPRFNPADAKLRELVRGAAWKAAAQHTTTGTADLIAAGVAEALEELAR